MYCDITRSPQFIQSFFLSSIHSFICGLRSTLILSKWIVLPEHIQFLLFVVVFFAQSIFQLDRFGLVSVVCTCSMCVYIVQLPYRQTVDNRMQTHGSSSSSCVCWCLCFVCESLRVSKTQYTPLCGLPYMFTICYDTQNFIFVPHIMCWCRYCRCWCCYIILFFILCCCCCFRCFFYTPS